MFACSRRWAPTAGLGLTLAAVVGAAHGQEALRFAHVYQEDTVYHEAAVRAGDALEEATNGDYTIDVFPASELGNEQAINDALTTGSVDLIYTGPAFLSQVAPEVAIADYPYVFRDLAHWEAFWQSDLLQKLMGQYEDATGNHYITHTYYGQRHVTANKPIKQPSDMEGLKIRVPNAPAYLMMPEATGANPTPMAFSEVYLALQQGTVDAQENPLPTIRAKQFYEVQSDISMTGHITATLVTLMSGVTAEELSEEDRKAVVEALTNASEWATEQIRANESDLVGWFREQGTAVHDDVDRAAFREAVRPRLTSSDVPWSPETFEAVQALAGES